MDLNRYNKLDKAIKEEFLTEIHTRVNRPDFWNLKIKYNTYGHLGYTHGNQIAMYVNAHPTYLITKGAEKFLVNKGYDLTKPHSRASLCNIRNEFRKKMLTYEHMIPTKVIRDLFEIMYNKTGSITKDEVRSILENCQVTIMLQTENDLINLAGYKSQMPENCNIEKNPELRYETSGVELSDNVVQMYGALMR